MLLAAPHSSAGTPQPAAAARISMSRAAAPPSRTYWCESRMPRLPPVDKFPQTRLRAAFSPGVGYSVVILDQSHSSSSATSCARPVSVPWPISERAIRITTVSSGRMTTQAFTSGTLSAACAPARPNGIRRPSDSPPPIAAALTSNERRLRCGHGIPPLRRGGGVDRLAHLLIGAAAADVGDGAVDIGVARLRVVFEQRGNRHDHPALAIAALRDVVVDPSLLHLVQRAVGGEPLDRRDILGADRTDRHRAGPRRDPVDVDRAGAALGDAAAIFGPGQAQRVAQNPQQRSVGIDIDLLR